LALSCADTSWEATRRADTVAAYHQFLRDNPKASQVVQAEERIEFLRVQNRPSVEAFMRFEKAYPDSPWLWELAAVVEPHFFEKAHAENTPESYREFLRRYSDGALTRRAKGNLEYVAQVQYRATGAVLQEFLKAFPDSDFATEAQKTLDLLESRRSTAISRMAVRVDVSANVADATRVRNGFASVVKRDYQRTGIEVITVPAGEDVPLNVEAWMHIEYQEVPTPGTFGGRAFISRARVRLHQRDQEEPIWDRTFEAPAEHLLRGRHGRDKTVFGNARYAFWRDFFVPVSTWATSRSRVQRIEYGEPVMSIDALDNRAAVLLEGGGVEFLDISSPSEPKVLQRYRRSRDLSRWSGIRVVPGNRALVFGNNGAELLEFTTRTAERLGRWEAPEIGNIRDVAVYGKTALIAGSKGLYAVRYEQASPVPSRLIESDLVGVEVRMPHVYLVSPTRLVVAEPKQLLTHLTGPKFEFGERLQARRTRIAGNSLYVFGVTAVVEFDLSNPTQPHPVAQLNNSELGELNDVASDGEHLYLLGHRGIQVTGRGARWVGDFIQVHGHDRMASKGRFLLVAGSDAVEVVDLSPYLTTSPASPAK
jgi:hypothetical protein